MVAHFRDLASHRIPVLQLYRRLLRHAGYVDLSLSEQKTSLSNKLLRKTISDAFKYYRPLMSSYTTLSMINEALKWEESLRLSILNPTDLDLKAYIRKDHETFKNLLGEKQKRREKNEKYQKREKVSRRTDKSDRYNLPPVGHELELLRERTLRNTYRRRLTKLGVLPQKNVDEGMFYVNTFLVPEYRLQKKNEIESIKRERIMSKPLTARLRVLRLNALVGALSYLNVTGQKQTLGLTSTIRKLMLSKDVEKLERLKEIAYLAKLEAQWQDDSVDSWTEPIMQSLALLRSRIKKAEKLAMHRKILIARKARIDHMLEGRHKRLVKRLESYKPVSLYEEHPYRIPSLPYHKS